MSNVPAGLGLPLASVAFGLLVIVGVLCWRKATKRTAPSESPEGRRRRLGAAGAAIGAGVVTIVLAQPFSDSARRSFAAWFLVVVVSFGPLLIAAALLGMWANRLLGDGVLLQVFQGAGRPLTETERSVRLRYVVAMVVVTVLACLVFMWSVEHIVF